MVMPMRVLKLCWGFLCYIVSIWKPRIWTQTSEQEAILKVHVDNKLQTCFYYVSYYWLNLYPTIFCLQQNPFNPLGIFFCLPMHKSSLGVHQVKLVVQSCPCFRNGSGVAQHTNSSLDFCQITTRYNCGGLVVDSDFETSGTPIHKLKSNLYENTI